MEEHLAKLAQYAESAASRIRVRSALNSVLWLISILIVPCIIGATQTEGNLRWALIGMLWAALILFVGAFIYFSINDPDKLRSEDYELRKQALQMIEAKGGRITISEAQIADITNPAVAEKTKIKGEIANG
jgi:hypothetical protein